MANAVLAAIVVLAGLTATSREVPDQTPEIECRELLDSLHAKVAENYAGYKLEIIGARRAEHDATIAQLQRLAQRVDRDGCLIVLKEYISWFDDPHLFLFQSTRLTPEETEKLRGSVPHMAVEEDSLLAELARRSSADPIEGIWTDRGMRMAIVPEPGAGSGHFLAVVAVSDIETLPKGSIRAKFFRNDDGSYTVSLRWPSLAVTEVRGTIHGGNILRISPSMWGKVEPAPSQTARLIDTFDVRRPTLTVRGRTVIVSVPSHDPRLRPVLDSLVEANRQTLTDAQSLIVDLRGNEGGGSQTTNALVPFLMGSETTPRQLSFGASVMLSSPDQIKYVNRSFGDPEDAFVKRLVEAMRESPGGLIPLTEPGEQPQVRPEVVPVYGPRRAAILVDSETVSAAEVLVLESQRTSRTIVIGTRTAGALDYQSTNIVRFSEDEDRWFLGYPTITAHARLPEGGMRGKGIVPNVFAEWKEIGDAYEFAEAVLARDK